MTRPSGTAPSAGQLALFDDPATALALRTATAGRYVLVGVRDQVYRRTEHDASVVEAVSVFEAATVQHLLATHRLRYDSRTVRVTLDDERRGATPIEPATPTRPPTSRERCGSWSTSSPPGKGLVTCGDGDWSGVIVRDGSSYLVEIEAGDVIGRARSYRHGAERLARHHGHRATSVEIEHEREFR
ncbi:hypothetical protein [Pseudonocardia sp. H11422]|uniref:hypothetical protein n=1 Tax=Pseudonocardia sp. H11422 TaxID=2835866 RepID=UPI001BDCE0AD|nr:hypothetical protein [Pseudonocardia sp. H11422]